MQSDSGRRQAASYLVGKVMKGSVRGYVVGGMHGHREEEWTDRGRVVVEIKLLTTPYL